MHSRSVPLVARRVRYVLVGVVAAGLLVGSLVPAGGSVDARLLGIGLDKWLHAGGYAVLAAAGGYAALDGDGRLAGRTLLAVVLLATGYGLAVELLQLAVATRSFAPADVAADAAGAVVGTLPYRRVRGG